jgi:cathepsin A (carboxypeptidase C)
MIYAGDADYICNWIGNKAWTTALEWSGSEDFQNAKDILWKSPRTGREAGMVKHAKNLLFVQVYEAGHMVPYDQPEHSLELINMFLHGDGHPKKKEFKIMKKEFKKLYF